MVASIHLPAALRVFTEQRREVAVAGSTAGEALASLAAKHPAVRQHLYNEAGELRPFINVYIGETNIKKLQGLDTPLPDGAVLTLVPAIAGGRERVWGKARP
ncbi:MAG: MoaD/ThiS family protein [Deltaproteobacteria bacterium]|jgi:adenylyltransferase/sulfurtransferase|nr:MoaD/ThiS family protein [Deltaproteobacteria bacterium]